MVFKFIHSFVHVGPDTTFTFDCCPLQFYKDKGIKVVTVYPPATYTTMTTDRDDMEPVPEKEAQPSDIAKAAMLVSVHWLSAFHHSSIPSFAHVA